MFYSVDADSIHELRLFCCYFLKINVFNTAHMVPQSVCMTKQSNLTRNNDLYTKFLAKTSTPSLQVRSRIRVSVYEIS